MRLTQLIEELKIGLGLRETKGDSSLELAFDPREQARKDKLAKQHADIEQRRKQDATHVAAARTVKPAPTPAKPKLEPQKEQPKPSLATRIRNFIARR